MKFSRATNTPRQHTGQKHFPYYLGHQEQQACRGYVTHCKQAKTCSALRDNSQWAATTKMSLIKKCRIIPGNEGNLDLRKSLPEADM